MSKHPGHLGSKKSRRDQLQTDSDQVSHQEWTSRFRLMHLPGLGPVGLKSLYNAYPSGEEILKAIRSGRVSATGFGVKKVE